jgi:hypothetical protein
MNDVDVISWCRDVMLQNLNADADIIYNASRLAEEDSKMYDMFTNYAYFEGNTSVQNSIYDDMVEYLISRGLC